MSELSSDAVNPVGHVESFHNAGICEPLLAELKACLMKSDCVLKQGNLPSDCLKNYSSELPEACRNLRVALFDCKRAKVSGRVQSLTATQSRPTFLTGFCIVYPRTTLQLDMRKRFRGNAAGQRKPSSNFPPLQPTVDPSASSS